MEITWPDWEEPNDNGQCRITDYFHQEGGNREIDLANVPGTSSDSDFTLRDRALKSKNKRKHSERSISDAASSEHAKRARKEMRDSEGFRVNNSNFTCELIKETQNKRFQASEKIYQLQLNDTVRGRVGDMLRIIGDMLGSFLDEVKNGMAPRDFARLVIISPELRDPIGIPWVLVRDLNVQSILELIERVLQSNQHFYLHSGVSIIVRHVHNPIGGKSSKPDPLDNDKFVKAKGAMISVSNKNDELCFGKAIVKAMYREDGPLIHPRYRSIQTEGPLLTTLAKELYKKAKVPEGRVTSEDFPKFQDVIAREGNIRLVVYSMRYSNAIMYQGPKLKNHSNIYTITKIILR